MPTVVKVTRKASMLSICAVYKCHQPCLSDLCAKKMLRWIIVKTISVPPGVGDFRIGCERHVKLTQIKHVV